MNGQTVILGFLFLILPVLVGVFIYLKSRKKLDEPVEEPSIRLLDGSAILNPEEKQGDIEGYTIEYSTGTTGYTDEELTEFVNVSVKWTNLGGFSRVQRIKLTLENGDTVIEPPKVFSKSSSGDSDYFQDFTSVPLQYMFQGKNVTDGTFIGTIKPKFEYSLTADGDDYQTISTTDISIVITKKDVRLTIESGTPEVKYFYPSMRTDDTTTIESLFREPVTLTSGNKSYSNIIFKPHDKERVKIFDTTNTQYFVTDYYENTYGTNYFVRDNEFLSGSKKVEFFELKHVPGNSSSCLLYTSPSPRDA